MTNYQYTIALMVFLIAYTCVLVRCALVTVREVWLIRWSSIFEVPSNYLLKKVKPSRWISFLIFSWGAITIGLGGSHNFAAVTAVRFLLVSTIWLISAICTDDVCRVFLKRVGLETLIIAPGSSLLTNCAGLFPGLIYYFSKGLSSTQI